MLADLVAGTLTVVLLLALMAALYVLAALVCARVSGWSRLGLAYGSRRRRAAAPTRTPRARIGSVIYRNIIGYEAAKEGLVLQCHFLDRIVHPTLVVPWAEIGQLRSVPLESYLSAGLDPSAPFFRQLLVRLGLAELSRGIRAARDLQNLQLEIDAGGGETVFVELLGNPADFAPHARLSPDRGSG